LRERLFCSHQPAAAVIIAPSNCRPTARSPERRQCVPGGRHN
jgi:hypothetical protein